MRVTETAHWLEWQDCANPILTEPFEAANGQVAVPEQPGAGIEWDEKAMQRYGCDG